MKTETIAETAERMKAGLSDINVKSFSDSVKEGYKDTYEAARRGVRQVRAVTEEGVEEIRNKFKSHPLRFMAIIASGAFILGSLAGWAGARSRRS